MADEVVGGVGGRTRPHPLPVRAVATVVAAVGRLSGCLMVLRLSIRDRIRQSWRARSRVSSSVGVLRPLGPDGRTNGRRSGLERETERERTIGEKADYIKRRWSELRNCGSPGKEGRKDICACAGDSE